MMTSVSWKHLGPDEGGTLSHRGHVRGENPNSESCAPNHSGFELAIADSTLGFLDPDQVHLLLEDENEWAKFAAELSKRHVDL